MAIMLENHLDFDAFHKRNGMARRRNQLPQETDFQIKTPKK